jgi:hypothetical protein
MTAEYGDSAGDEVAVPLAIADIFLALVGVVIMMLLALVPALHAPGSLAAPPPLEIWRAELAVGGAQPAVLVAEEDGLRLVSQVDRLVPLDAILDDSELAAGLRAASAEPGGILLVIRSEGQEAAFLFSALAGGLGLETVHHLRLDTGCAYLLDQQLARRCRASAPAGAAR